MQSLVWVALGSSLGGCSRFLIGLWLNQPAFPWGTLLINATGCFAMGLMLGSGLAGRAGAIRDLFGSGFLGAFTTMSAFSGETWTLHQAGDRQGALLYATATVGLALLAVWAGALLASWWFPGPSAALESDA